MCGFSPPPTTDEERAKNAAIALAEMEKADEAARARKAEKARLQKLWLKLHPPRS
jgi:hypothetical protein